MAYDSARGMTVLFGGHGAGSAAASQAFGDTWQWIGGSLGNATTYGVGCGAPALSLSPVVGSRPVLGTMAQASLANIPATLAFVSVGWNDTNFGPLSLPLSLAAYGMPGCNLLQSAESPALPVNPTGVGTAVYSLLLPNLSALLGARLYLQGWASAPSYNSGNVIVSNGIDWRVGNL